MAKAPASDASTTQARGLSPSPRLHTRLWVALMAFLAFVRLEVSGAIGGVSGQRFGRDSDGSLNLSGVIAGLIGTLVSIIFGFVAIFLGAAVVAALLPGYFSSGNKITGAFANASINDSTGIANTIAHLMPMLLGVLIVLGPLGFIAGLFVFEHIKRKKGAGSYS